MKRVIIESPYSGFDSNRAYLRLCLLDSLNRGEAPYASHGLYTWCLDDNDAEQRAKGMKAGFAWTEKADLCAVYEDFGVSTGMQIGIQNAAAWGIPIEYRKIK
jgi:hypothetical protein